MGRMKSSDYLFLPSPGVTNLEEWKTKLEESYRNLRNDILANTIFRKAVTTDYEMRSRDSYIGVTDTTAARTITLPDVSRAGESKIVIINDESGGAGANNITVAGFGSDTIDGSATATIAANYGSLTLICDGSNWFTI